MFTQRLNEELNDYIRLSYVSIDGRSDTEPEKKIPSPSNPNTLKSLEDEPLVDYVILHRQPTFRELLFSMIDESNAIDTDIFIQAGMDYDHFENMRFHPDYEVDQKSIFSLALALELNLKETEDLLHSAGYHFSDHSKFDLILKFCINHSIFKLTDVNEALSSFELEGFPIL